ncbi:MAG TPA: histidine phosphatase family protein [Bryobacteraceae bacterium]|jgi:broad specificity phosphatase PhoE|nr:histidine phosphatase family protein [Bryobacteraceae bacterium]
MTSKSEIWLIRHGETEWSLSGAHTSRTDLPLTPEGERRGRALGEVLHGKQFALVLSSPMRRALDTAWLAGLTAEISTDLCEWDYGAYEGRTTPDIQKEAPGWTIWTSTPPGGETAEQVAARADRVIERALQASGDVALFAHGHFLRVLGARWIGIEPQGGRYLALSTGSVSVLGWERETRVIRMWNTGV